MNKLLMGVIITSSALAQDMSNTLSVAKIAWGVELLPNQEIQFKFEPLNSCDIRVNHELATTQMLDYVTTTRFDGDTPPIITHRTVYVIRINSNCRWPTKRLENVVTHEYGHLLLGSEYHSLDKHSIMFKFVGDGSEQSVTKKDIAALSRR